MKNRVADGRSNPHYRQFADAFGANRIRPGIGQIHLRAGRPTDAIEALKISIWSAESVGARIALAEAYVKSGDSSAARAEIDRALALDPDSADAKRLLAQIK